jgi:hypothetical protein
MYDRYGASRSENSDGARNHTRIGAGIDCANGHAAEGVAAMEELLKDKKFDALRRRRASRSRHADRSSPKKKGASRRPSSSIRLRLALGELEAAARAGAAVLLALDHAAVAGEEAGAFMAPRRRARTWRGAWRMPWRTAPAWPDRPPPETVATTSNWLAALRDVERLLDDHLLGRTREVDRLVAAVDRDLAGAGLHPDAGDGVLAPAGGVGATLGVDFLLAMAAGVWTGAIGAFFSSANDESSVAISAEPRILAVQCGDVELLGLLSLLLVIRALVDAQVLHLRAAERSAGDHALDGLDDDALGEAAFQALAQGLALDAAGMAGVPVEDFALGLAAGQADLLGVDDDDVVAAIDVRGEGRLVLAAQRMAMIEARRPRTSPSASISTHFFCTSAVLRLKVFMGLSAVEAALMERKAASVKSAE